MTRTFTFTFTLFAIAAGCSGGGGWVASPDAPQPDAAQPDAPQPILVTDVLVGSGSGYVNIEISPDGGYATFLYGVAAGSGVTYTAWLSQVDPTAGVLVPPDGLGVALGSASELGQPQFGEDAQGVYSVYLDRLGEFVVVRPDGSGTATTTLPGVDVRRAFPYPAHDPASSSDEVAFQIRDPMGSGYSQEVADLSQAVITPAQVSNEPASQTHSPAMIVDFARWLDDSSAFTVGTYGDACMPDSPRCTAQIMRVDVAGGSAVTSTVTDDTHDKIDMFPFADSAGQVHLLGGLDLGSDGGLYTLDAGGGEFELAATVPFDLQQTHMIEPGGAQSFEPFTWGGDQYAVYEVIDRSTGTISADASAFPGEIWVTKLDPAPISCRVSAFDPADPARARVDAEPVSYAGGTRVALFYHSSAPRSSAAPLLFDLRRIDLGDKPTFDANCAAGTAFPQ